MKPDQERVRNLLTDTVTLLCKNGLQYQTELRVQGVLGITLDNNDVFIVHINEKFGDAIGGALTIRSDEGDAVKTLLGGSRLDVRKSHDASWDDTAIAVSSGHKRRRRSRESSASPALSTNSQQQTNRRASLKEERSSGADGSVNVHHKSTDSALDVHASKAFIQIKVKTEMDDVVVVAQKDGIKSQDIQCTTDQCAMQESYPSEFQGSYQPFGENLGVTDSSTNSGADGTAPPPTKRRAASDNTQDSFGGSSEMAPTSDAGGPFITGIIRNETMTGDVVPQTTTATSWDTSQMPDFGTLTARDSQMILDSTPGCSTWDISQQSQVSAMATTSHTLANMSDQSFESAPQEGHLPGYVLQRVKSNQSLTEQRQAAAARSRRYRQRKREQDPMFRQREAEKKKMWRQEKGKLSEEALEHQRKLHRIRQARYRERRKSEMKYVPSKLQFDSSVYILETSSELTCPVHRMSHS